MGPRPSADIYSVERTDPDGGEEYADPEQDPPHQVPVLQTTKVPVAADQANGGEYRQLPVEPSWRKEPTADRGRPRAMPSRT
jgi:hypothetical protein